MISAGTIGYSAWAGEIRTPGIGYTDGRLSGGGCVGLIQKIYINEAIAQFSWGSVQHEIDEDKKPGFWHEFLEN
ncbi:hypothetical protein NG797_23235 [Laspinema sp. D5]|nr:hypothetical protein [Laspinema sp. D3d]